MEVRFPQSAAPVLLFLDQENTAPLFSAAEFKKLAPHWKIVRVHNRISAMHFLADGTPPLALVVDLHRLDADGMELIEWVKGQPRFRTLPVIIHSTSNDASQRQTCLALGASTYRVNSTSAKELWRNIRSIVKVCEESRIPSQVQEEMACV
jgi:CheY-like chemotaxis protein